MRTIWFALRGTIGFFLIFFLSVLIGAAAIKFFGASNNGAIIVSVVSIFCLIYPTMKVLKINKEDEKDEREEGADVSKWK